MPKVHIIYQNQTRKNKTNKNWLNSLNDYLDALDYEHDPDEKWDNKKWFEVIVLYD